MIITMMILMRMIITTLIIIMIITSIKINPIMESSLNNKYPILLPFPSLQTLASLHSGKQVKTLVRMQKILNLADPPG